MVAVLSHATAVWCGATVEWSLGMPKEDAAMMAGNACYLLFLLIMFPLALLQGASTEAVGKLGVLVLLTELLTAQPVRATVVLDCCRVPEGVADHSHAPLDGRGQGLQAQDVLWRAPYPASGQARGVGGDRAAVRGAQHSVVGSSQRGAAAWRYADAVGQPVRGLLLLDAP
mmetsp:Transcript_31238/g.81898  ORF Transcript_31238/g.81898 Transcript_31238/m.81898 type:complete len:171 (-) Transcript_31238:54-566(-)